MDLPGASGVGAASRDGTRIAVGGATGVRVFDLVTRQAVGGVVGLPGDTPTGFVSGGRLVVANTTAISTWRIGAGMPPSAVAFEGGQQGPVFADFVPETEEVVTQGIFDNSLRWWNGRTGAPITRRGLEGAHAFVSFSPDGRTVVGPLGDGSQIGVWDRATGARLAVIPGSPGAQVGVGWRPHSNVIAVWAGAQSVDLWDVRDRSRPVRTGAVRVPGSLPAGVASSLYVSFSADGLHMALVDQAQSTVSMFDTVGTRRRWTRAVVGGLLQVEFSPDDRTVAVARQNAFSAYDVSLWDARTGRPLHTFTPAGTEAAGVVFVRDGRSLVVASQLATTGPSGTASAVAQLWDVRTLEPIGEPLPLGVPGTVFASRDSTSERVLIGSGSGKAALWDIDVRHWEREACAIAGRTLSRAEWSRYLPGRRYAPACR
jgi:WD40 repeat protein